MSLVSIKSSFISISIDGHNGAPPTEIDMKLDFMETKLITKADVLEGY
jgi:hypothetical protein